jgi:hypothetical protein
MPILFVIIHTTTLYTCMQEVLIYHIYFYVKRTHSHIYMF